MISAPKARKLLSNRCIGFLASIVDSSKETELMPNDISVVRDYVLVFLKDLPRLPLDREIMFNIELVPGTALVSRALYQSAPIELKEPKV